MNLNWRHYGKEISGLFLLVFFVIDKLVPNIIKVLCSITF